MNIVYSGGGGGGGGGESTPTVQGVGGSLEPEDPCSKRYGACGAKYARNYNCSALHRRAILMWQGSPKALFRKNKSKLEKTSISERNLTIY